MHYKLLPHLWYTISSAAGCDVDCSNGISIHLPANFQHFLFADMESIDVSGEATVTQNPPNFTPYSESRGEEWTADLRIGHAAADAVAAVCALTLGDLAQGGTLTDSNGQSVQLEAPHAYATGQVDIADATESGSITFGEHDAVTFEAQIASNADGNLIDEAGAWGNPMQLRCLADPENPAGEYEVLWEGEEGFTSDDEFVSVFNSEQDFVEAEIVEIEEIEHFHFTAKGDYSGTEGNRLVVTNGVDYYTTQLTGGADARSPQDVVDILNENEDCPAVAVPAHVEAQDAKAVFTPLESYGPGLDYQLSIMEDDAEVNSWAWQAQEGDGVQELVAALNDDTGQLWENTNCVEASLEDGKVVLRKLEAHGAASNGYSVNLDDNPPFEESEETPIEGGRDAYDTITLTAKEYGVNDTIAISGSLFENATGMSGGHGDYTVDELLEAIGDEFTDITAAAGSAEGTITLTANTAGKAANTVTYTATGCFGSGVTRQGSTTRGKDAVEQTEYGIFLNGEPLDVGGSYTAGNGINITDGVVSADLGAVASSETRPVSGAAVKEAVDAIVVGEGVAGTATNNTFTQTNTFNGAVALNGPVTLANLDGQVAMGTDTYTVLDLLQLVDNMRLIQLSGSFTEIDFQKVWPTTDGWYWMIRDLSITLPQCTVVKSRLFLWPSRPVYAPGIFSLKLVMDSFVSGTPLGMNSNGLFKNLHLSFPKATNLGLGPDTPGCSNELYFHAPLLTALPYLAGNPASVDGNIDKVTELRASWTTSWNKVAYWSMSVAGLANFNLPLIKLGLESVQFLAGNLKDWNGDSATHTAYIGVDAAIQDSAADALAAAKAQLEAKGWAVTYSYN